MRLKVEALCSGFRKLALIESIPFFEPLETSPSLRIGLRS